MGLKDKALQFEKELNLGATQSAGVEKTPAVVESAYDARDPEEILAQNQTNRANQTSIPEVSLEEDFNQDKFLSSDDLYSSSRPVMHGLAQQAQIESLLNLIEFSKELSASQTATDLWDTVIFTLIGQLGVKEVAIFFKEEQGIALKATQGFVIEHGFQISFESFLLKSLSKEHGIIYTEKLIQHLKGLDKTWFSALNSDLLIPIVNYEEMVGFIILGKTIAQMDYNLEDLMYLKTLGELLGSFYHSIQKLIQISSQKAKLQDQSTHYDILDRYTRAIQKSTGFSEINNIFLQLITHEYQTSKFIFLLKQGKQFLPNLHKNLDQKTIKKFATSTRESWIVEMKRQTGWYEYENFLENTNFTKKFSAEDLSLITKVLIMPLHFSNEIEGIFILFNINHDISIESLNYLGVIINTYYWAFLAHKSRTHDMKSLEDPLFDLRTLINDYEKDFQTKKVPYSLIYITVENASRLSKFKSQKFLENQSSYLKKTLHSMVSEKEACLEIFPAKFLLILRGREGEKQSKYIFNSLKEAINLEYKLEKHRPIIKHKTLNRMKQEPVSIHSFLFD